MTRLQAPWYPTDSQGDGLSEHLYEDLDDYRAYEHDDCVRRSPRCGTGFSRHGSGSDMETGNSGEWGFALAPGMDRTENMLRWGFIRKVYGIISLQLLLTAVVAGVIIMLPEARMIALKAPVHITCLFSPFVFILLLAFHKDRFPLNYALLGGFTLAMSVSVGAICSLYPSPLVLQAVAITAAVVVGLTLYTFVAVRKGRDFSFLGPVLFASLLAFLVWGVIQVFIPMAPIGYSIFSLLGAVLFSALLVYDTDRLIKREGLDNYIWVSVSIYLDIVNVFLYVLQALNGRFSRH